MAGAAGRNSGPLGVAAAQLRQRLVQLGDPWCDGLGLMGAGPVSSMATALACIRTLPASLIAQRPAPSRFQESHEVPPIIVKTTSSEIRDSEMMRVERRWRGPGSPTADVAGRSPRAHRTHSVRKGSRHVVGEGEGGAWGHLPFWCPAIAPLPAAGSNRRGMGRELARDWRFGNTPIRPARPPPAFRPDIR